MERQRPLRTFESFYSKFLPLGLRGEKAVFRNSLMSSFVQVVRTRRDSTPACSKLSAEYFTLCAFRPLQLHEKLRRNGQQMIQRLTFPAFTDPAMDHRLHIIERERDLEGVFPKDTPKNHECPVQVLTRCLRLQLTQTYPCIREQKLLLP